MSVARACPVCGAESVDSVIFMEENIDSKKLSSYSFSSRKVPEFMCHRLVKCLGCDLVYVSNPPKQEDLAVSYHLADYDSSEEAGDAALSYIEAMRPILNKMKKKFRALDIGSGNGVLLELLQQEGFVDLVGIEPSAAAIDSAPEHRKKWLKEGIFDGSIFEPNSFDLICCFMTMEHVSDPKEIALAAQRLLSPGGVFVTVTHDYQSLVNRILGKKSPIIDIEHMQLFSKMSLSKLFQLAGFEKIVIKPFVNKYSLVYWIRLMPLAKKIKLVILKFLSFTRLAKVRIKISVGNTISFGFKKAAK